MSKEVGYVRLKLFMTEFEMKVAEAQKANFENDGWTLVETRPSYMKYEK